MSQKCDISKETLHMMDLSMENFKMGIVSEPLDLSAYAYLQDLDDEDDDPLDKRVIPKYNVTKK